MNRRQKLIQIAEVVLAELPGGVAETLHEIANARVFLLQADWGAGDSNLGKSGANWGLPADECGSSGRARILTIPVCESRSFPPNSVNVGRLIGHDALVID